MNMFWVAFFILLLLNNNELISQSIAQKRIKENFDFNWKFHKCDIAIKKVVKV